MSEVPAWAIYGFGGMVVFALCICADALEKIAKRIERQNKMIDEMSYRLRKRFPD